MTLTEQWKRGELEAGWYYVLLFSNEEYITFIDGNWVVDDRLIGADIKEVLAPVPSYEEWRSTGKFAMEAMKVAEENQQLKELLKECGNQLYEYSDVCFQEGYEIEREEVLKLKTKVDNAIGERK